MRPTATRSPGGLQREEEIRQVLRRLARRARNTPRQGLPNKEGSRAPPTEDASHHRRKKSPDQQTPAAICQAWAKAAPKHSHQHYVAQELAREISNAGTLTHTLVAGLCATWRQRYARNTCATRNKQLRRLLRHLTASGQPDLDKAVSHLGGRPRTITATPEEVSRLLTRGKIHVQLLVHLCSDLALRFSEAYNLRGTDYDPDAHTIRIIAKGDRTRTLPTTPEIETLIKAAMQTDRQGRCIETLRGHSLTPRRLRDHFHQLVKETGCNPALIPHDLRRTTATKLYATTKDLRAAQHLLGHTALTSTLHYLAPLAKEELGPLLEALRRPPARA